MTLLDPTPCGWDDTAKYCDRPATPDTRTLGVSWCRVCGACRGVPADVAHSETVEADEPFGWPAQHDEPEAELERAGLAAPQTILARCLSQWAPARRALT